VCHHNPFEPEIFSKDFAVRVLETFGWAHSLPLDPAAGQKKKETPKGWPFLIHLGEGTDEESANEIFQLNHAGALDVNTVIIHGLGLGEKGSALLRAAHAGFIWCPSSNRFLFGEVLAPDEIRRFPKVALGSDSPLTAQGDLLDEVRFAYEELQTPPGELYQYVTHCAAALLGMRGGEGKVQVGGVADLTIVRDPGLSPADTLATLTYREIELVLLGGRVQLASEQVRRQLPPSVCEGLQPIAVEGHIRWIRAPVDGLFRQTSAYLNRPIYLGGKRVSSGN
jgi:cytosine/adenosine deaminase-related metal-dependent hydrolase